MDEESSGREPQKRSQSKSSKNTNEEGGYIKIIESFENLEVRESLKFEESSETDEYFNKKKQHQT